MWNSDLSPSRTKSSFPAAKLPEVGRGSAAAGTPSPVLLSEYRQVCASTSNLLFWRLINMRMHAIPVHAPAVVTVISGTGTEMMQA